MSIAMMTEEISSTGIECRECGMDLETWEIDLSETRNLCSCCC